MKLRLVRETLSGSKEEITFQHKGEEYIVKNLSEDAVYVSFEESATDDESILVPSMFGQICTCGASVDTIYVKGTGDVEVQQL